MNILLVNYYSIQSGGAGTSTLLIARSLINQGNKVIIASTENYPEVKTYIFKKIRKIPIFFLRDLYLTRFFLKIIEKEKIDIIHSSDLRFTSVACIKAAKKINIPCVIHYRDYWFTCHKGDLLYKKQILCNQMTLFKCIKCNGFHRAPWEIYKYIYLKKRKKYLNQSYVSLAVSNFVKDNMIKNGITNKIVTIYDIINDVKYFKSKENEKMVVSFAGKLIYHRGIKQLLKVAELLKKRNDIVFKIIGDGELFNYCTSYINKNKLNNIVLTGQIEYEKMKEIMEHTDIFLFLSLLPEPFSRAIIEFMSFGKTIIASDLGGNREVVKNNYNGYLVDPNNKESVAKILIKLKENKELRMLMGQRSHNKSKDFIGDKVGKNLIEIYDSIIQK